ncbi:MAG TPA: carboxypeptidase-like regulatory domain-containing protein, partial [Kofleriaceae bacterium]|nr:carboxypeptidase-like regulatory domain-containing protein [Kofleriaceae bacterium]
MDRRVIGAGVLLLAVGGAAYWMYGRDGAGTKVATPEAVGGAAAAGPASAAERVAPASVSGTVRGEDGAPIAGAAVQLIRSGDDDSDYSMRTGADGGFTVRDLPPGEYRASASAVDYVPTAGVVLTLGPGEAGTLELVLERGGNRVTGTVSDVSGGPVADATVRFAPIHGILSIDTGESFAAITDAAGAFALNIADGHYLASASHVDYVGRATRVELRAGERVVNFALAPGGVVEGRVLSAVDGAAVPGAIVQFSREALMTLPGGGVMSTGGRRGVRIADAQGGFRITGLESGVVRLGARGPGAASADEVTVGLGIGEQVSGVELFVDRARTIRGVVQVKGGAPVEGVQVMASGGMGEVRIEALAATDAQGGFVIDGVLPGAYRLEVVSDRYLGPSLGHPV